MLLLKFFIRPWRLAPFTHFFSTLIFSFLLLLGTFFFWLGSGLDPVVSQLESNKIITVYLDPKLEPSDTKTIVDKINQSLGAHPKTKAEIEVVNSNEFLHKLSIHEPTLSQELQTLGPELTTIIPNYISVHGSLPEDLDKKIMKMNGVETVENAETRFLPLIKTLVLLQNVSWALITGIVIALGLGFIHLAVINKQIQHNALQIMKFWGATETSLIVPILLSGALTGVISSLIGWAAWHFGAEILLENLQKLSPLFLEINSNFSYPLGLILIVLGVFMGIFSKIIAGLPRFFPRQG